MSVHLFINMYLAAHCEADIPPDTPDTDLCRRGRVWNCEGGGSRVSRSGERSRSTGRAAGGGGGRPWSVSRESME